MNPKGVTLAKWIVSREPGRGRDKLSVHYLNLTTGKKYLLGRLSSDVPDEMCVEWALSHGAPGPHDVIVLSDGNELLYVSPGKLVLNYVKLPDGTTVSTAGAASA